MTFEEAKKIFLNRGYVEVSGGTYYDADKWRESITVISKWLEQEPCEDAVRRQAVLNTLDKMDKALDDDRSVESYKALLTECYKDLTPVTPKEKTGHWIPQPRYDGDDQPDLVCPNCGFKISWWDIGNFCAKCGTGLEGGAG